MRAPLTWLLAAATLTGCSGTVGDPSGSANPGSGVPSAGSGGGLIDDPGGAPPSSGGSTAASCTPASPIATTRVMRLTHHQYDNTIRALTGLDVHPAAEFLADQRQAGFDRGIDLQVGEVLGKSYRAAAESIAAQVVSNATAYRTLVPCDPAAPGQADACAQAYIASFGQKAYRRPLTAAEQASYLALFKTGVDLVDTGDAFQKGVTVTLEAFLQSPKFLYRTELSATRAGALIALDPYEIATRLSYLIGNSAPDGELVAAAASGALSTPEQVAAQASRLVRLAAAAETVRDFHHQWLDLDIYANKLAKDPARYPEVTPELAPALQNEVTRFVDAVTFDRRRGFRSLMTAPFSFVNATTAAIYGVPGQFGDTLTETALDPTQRAGLITQVGFLATHAFSTQSSPIHRGVFIQRRLLCTTIPAPPPNIPALPPLDGSKIKTTRQQVDQHTAPDACAGCHHSVINPVGFGLENYDAIGRYRAEENGYPVDASGKLAATANEAPFENGVGLARAIAEAPEARHCYATNWLRYTLGRSETAADACALEALSAALQNDDYTATDLLVDMTRTKAFLYRAPDEAP